MTPEQQQQITAVQARIRSLRMDGASTAAIVPTLRKEGFPEAAIQAATQNTA